MNKKFDYFCAMINATDQIKPALLARSQEILRDQIQDIQQQLTNLQQSSEIEEKSSAGDKYETHQEMLNQNRDILQKRLSSTKVMLNQINAVPVKQINTVEEGALIEVPMGKIWVSVAMGKVNLDGIDYQLVSKESPLITALWGLKEGEISEFRGNKIKISQIL
ncbi:hypothetical protein ACFSKL_02890 [Belliella marina]|uniref:Uncharacterized protein n=1 Tax=Belliella marina TaxID=1644146 RepID=A0ABW4VJK5_9BACT